MKTTKRLVSKDTEEARQQLLAILAAAATARSTIFTRHGRPGAAVVPASALTQRRAGSLHELAGTGHNLWGNSSAETIAKLRDEWKR